MHSKLLDLGFFVGFFLCVVLMEAKTKNKVTIIYILEHFFAGSTVKYWKLEASLI